MFFNSSCWKHIKTHGFSYFLADRELLKSLKSAKKLTFPKQNQCFSARPGCHMGPCLCARQTITVWMDFGFFSVGASDRIGNRIGQEWQIFERTWEQSRHGQMHNRTAIEAQASK